MIGFSGCENESSVKLLPKLMEKGSYNKLVLVEHNLPRCYASLQSLTHILLWSVFDPYVPQRLSKFLQKCINLQQLSLRMKRAFVKTLDSTEEEPKRKKSEIDLGQDFVSSEKLTR